MTGGVNYTGIDKSIVIVLVLTVVGFIKGLWRDALSSCLLQLIFRVKLDSDSPALLTS